MSAPFKVGEIVVGQNMVIDTKYNGMEGEVICTLDHHACHDPVTGTFIECYGYVVRWGHGEESVQEPHTLRRKRPPGRDIDTVVSWKDCAWQPTGVPA